MQVLAGVVEVHDLGGPGELRGGDVPDPGGAVAQDGELPDVAGAAADPLGLHEAGEHVRGLERGHVAGGIPVTDGVAVLIDLVLGEEHAELDLAGPGAAVLTFAVSPRGLLRGHGHAGAVDRRVELVRQRGRRERHELAGSDHGGPVPDGGGRRGAAGLSGPLDALGGQAHSGQGFQQPGGFRERPGGSSLVVHRPQARRHRLAGHAEPGVPGGQPVAAGRAVIPGTREDHRPEHRVDHLVPAGDEPCLVSLAARHPRAAVARIGGQQLLQHAAARLQHPGADHRLGSLHARTAAAQRPGRFRRQPAYLSGFLLRDRRPEPPFSPSGTKGASVRAAGLASQIFSFTSAICSLTAANSACRATSRRTFSTSPAASCRPTVPRPRALLVHNNLGP